MIFQTGGAVDVKKNCFAKCCFKLLCRKANPYQVFQITTLLWDCSFNSGKAKQFNQKTMSDFTADRLYSPNYCMRMPNLYDEIS
jgi:hypothetical protein